MKPISLCLLWLWLAALPAMAGATKPVADPKFPFLFMENKGQVLDQYGNPRSEVLFTANSHGMKVFLEATGLHYQFERQDAGAKEVNKTRAPRLLHGKEEPQASEITAYRVDMRLEGVNQHPMVLKEDLNPYYENYYNMAHAPEGILDVHAYERIVVQEVYPHIDWIIYGTSEGMKYDFLVRPGGDPSRIRMTYAGAQPTEMVDGNLEIETPMGKIVEDAPISWMEGGMQVATSFVVKGGEVSFALGDYDSLRTLRIDPSLVWASYYGGTVSEHIFCTSTDIQNNLYIGGETHSTNAIAMGGHQITYGGGNGDAFLAKFDASGMRVWATYYGASSGVDWGNAIVVDSSGNVYFGGETQSTTGIAASGHQNTYGSGFRDAFLAKFNSLGVRQWGTYYGGSAEDRGFGLALDAVGNVYLAGTTDSQTAIGSGGYQNSYGGGFLDGFIVKFNPSGLRQWGTYYGGTGQDYGLDISIDSNDNLYLVGKTNGNNGIASNGYQNTLAGNFDAYMVKFDAAMQRQWATYYGGPNEEDVYASEVDHAGNIYLAGATWSTTGIAIAGHQMVQNGSTDGLLVKLDASGNPLWATYYGGSGTEFCNEVVVDASDNVFLAGDTGSATDIAMGGIENSLVGYVAMFLAKFNSNGIRYWGSYFCSVSASYAGGCATDQAGNVYIGGVTTTSLSYAISGFQSVFGGGPNEALMYKIHDDCSSAPIAACQNTTVSLVGSSATVMANQIDNGTVSLCGNNPSLSVSPGTFACGDLGQQLVTLTATDTNGTSTCTATVTIVDGEAPAIVCPSNVSVTAPTGGCTAVVNFTAPTAVDNCSNAVVSQVAGLVSGATFPEGITVQTFQAVDSSGNADTCTFIVTVQSNNATFQAFTECAGFSIVVGNQTYAASGIYVDTLTAVSGCDSVVTTQLAIAAPIDTSVTINGLLLAANASGATSYQWLDCNNGMAVIAGENGQTFTATSSGLFAVAVTVGNCTDTSECSSIVVGMEGSWLPEMSLYPNPHHGKFVVDFGMPLEFVEVTVVDMAGKVVHATRIRNAASAELNLRHLSPGMYAVEIYDGVRKKVLRMEKW